MWQVRLADKGGELGACRCGYRSPRPRTIAKIEIVSGTVSNVLDLHRIDGGDHSRDVLVSVIIEIDMRVDADRIDEIECPERDKESHSVLLVFSRHRDCTCRSHRIGTDRAGRLPRRLASGRLRAGLRFSSTLLLALLHRLKHLNLLLQLHLHLMALDMAIALHTGRCLHMSLQMLRIVIGHMNKNLES